MGNPSDPDDIPKRDNLILSLRHELESKLILLSHSENDLLLAHNENERIFALAATAEQESRDFKRQMQVMKQELRTTEEASDYAIASVATERVGTANHIARLERKIGLLTKAKSSAEREVQMLKTMAEQDREEYDAKKRVLVRTAHVAEVRLKSLLEQLATDNSNTLLSAYASHSHSRTSHNYDSEQRESKLDGLDVSEPEVASSIASPGVSGVCLAEELLFQEYQSDGEWDSSVEYADEDEKLAEDSESKGSAEINENLGLVGFEDYQVDDGTQEPTNQDRDHQIIVNNIGHEIMEKLAELALICAEMGCKTIKIHRTADWMVVWFP